MTDFKREGRRSAKKNLDGADARRRRTETAVKIRKDKKEENMAKRRAMATNMVTAKSAETTEPAQTAVGTIPATVVKKVYGVEHIPELAAAIKNPDAPDGDILEAVRGIRRMLSQEKSPPVEEVIAAGVVPRFVTFLSRSDNQDLQFDSAWALTNIASTDRTRDVVDCGSVSPLITLLLSPNADVREQSAWCLGNIAGDCPELRDMVLQAQALPPLLQNLAQPASESLLQNCVWTLSNMCRGKPQPPVELILPAVPALAHMIKQDNKEVIMDASWALSYLCDGDNSRIQMVLDGGIAPTMISRLGHESSGVITPALRTLGNCVSGSDEQTQLVLDCGILDHINSLLSHPRRNIRKETCWLLSNIAAGTRDQIQQLLARARELRMVVDAVMEAEWEVRKEAVWVVSNIATGGSDLHIQALVELNVIPSLCSMLALSDSKIIMVALDAIEAILKAGERMGRRYDCDVDEADGIEKIEQLQEHANDSVYEKAIHIIEHYFGGEVDEDENLAPEANADSFKFGVQKSSEQKLGGNVGQGITAQQPMQQFNFGA